VAREPSTHRAPLAKRRLLRPAEMREVLRPKPVALDVLLDPVGRRLAGAHTIGDLRRLARRRAPRAVFDYTDGAADNEQSLTRARRAYRRVEFRPAILRGAAEVDTSTKILGERSGLPFGLAPVGFTRMMHHEGERAAARVAEGAGSGSSSTCGAITRPGRS
jgi:L-lactate dehydrogenase (cytochrome)